MADAQGLASGPNGAIEEEIALRDAIRRVEVDRKDRYAIHVHLSQLRQQYRQPHYMRIAAQAFDPLVLNHDATLYTLANFDMVLLCRGVPVEAIDAPLAKVRTLFSEDPLTFGDVGSLDDRFTTWYDLSLPSDFETFHALVEDLGS
ncbi:MAG: hypothetical protein FJ038_13710, partial [Chloroflexi bacterium]|nr:hypothetical protein [Chloroflexota bacterium]